MLKSALKRIFSVFCFFLFPLILGSFGCGFKNVPGTNTPGGNTAINRLQLHPIPNEYNGPFQLHLLLKIKRKDLFSEGAQPLSAIIANLSAQQSNHGLNLALIFENGSQKGQEAMHKDHRLPEESLSLYTPIGVKRDDPFTLQLTGPKIGPRLYPRKDWMDYSGKKNQIGADIRNTSQVTFVNFANRYLGGGWKTHGNVQEEQMVQMCSDFTHLLSIFNASTPLELETRTTTYAEKDPTTATPLFLENMRCFQKLSNGYETTTSRIYGERYKAIDAVMETHLDAPAINMIAMAAPQLKGSEKGVCYTSTILQDLFFNAYTAFRTVKIHDEGLKRHSVLVTGLWGAGAFRHSELMSVAVQYLAAHLVFDAQDHIYFTGVNPESNVFKTSLETIDNAMKEGGTVGDVLKTLEKKSCDDNLWKTKP